MPRGTRLTDQRAAQRVRLIFGKGEEVKYVSHLGVLRAWERIVRRAGLPLAYSQGFNQRPKLTFASALSVGHTGRQEVLDLELRERMSLESVMARLRPQLPPGFLLHSAMEVPLDAPSTQSLLRYAVYRVVFDPCQSATGVIAGLNRLLSAPTLPRQREVKGQSRSYDLRPLIQDLWYICSDERGHVVGMILVNRSAGAGRVDEVAAELGLPLKAVERVRLIFEGEAVDWAAIRQSLTE
jgi:radical SAM-linked protein